MAVEGYRQLESVYRWMKRLERTLPGLPERYFSGAAAGMEERAKGIVQATVYDVYRPRAYDRTYKMLNAVSVVPLIDVAGVEVGIMDSPELRTTSSDQARADALGADVSSYIYPALMLPDAIAAFGGHPYWQDTANANPTASLPRDFFGAWFTVFYEEAFNGLDLALARAIA